MLPRDSHGVAGIVAGRISPALYRCNLAEIRSGASSRALALLACLRRCVALLLVLMVGASAAVADPLAEPNVPGPLKPWVPWVLHNADERACPFRFNSSNGERHCAWPGRLNLELDGRGGRFTFDVEVYRAQWLALPGEAQFWPQQVTIDGKPAPVTAEDGVPGVFVANGTHAIAGRFEWDALPENLKIPGTLGLVSLSIDRRTIEVPRIDEQGRLWLQANADAAASGARLEVRVERLLTDAIPFQVTTRFALTASGKNQEVVLPAAVLAEFVPLSLNSALPARLESDGKLRVQVRAGRWEVIVTARRMAPMQALALPGSGGEEVWAFAPQNALRVVNVEGGTQIDAQQTQLPAEWKRYPAYRMQTGDVLRFNELKRGDPQPAADALTLTRNAWLDFDGGGFTLQDRISGTLSRTWRLEAAAPLVLGRVAVDGQDQLITRGEKDAGVEVRRGRADILADSRIDAPKRTLAATGWQHDFQSLSMRLNLPPGWRLLTATGVDQVSGAWLSQWNNLLDFFIVLIIALGCGKLWGWRWVLIAALALALSYHESSAPRTAWIVALAAVALARVVVNLGRFGTAVLWLKRLSWLALALVLIPFLVQQVRQTLYPVLERPGAEFAPAANVPEPVAAPAAPAAEAMRAPSAPPPAAQQENDAAASSSAGNADYARILRAQQPKMQDLAQRSQQLDRLDPKAKVQTGPGLPSWNWRVHTLSWSGPVQRTQEIELWLVSPAMNALITVLRLALVLWLLARLADYRWRVPRLPSAGGAGAAAVAILAAILVAMPGESRAEATPSPELLKELKDKLLQPPQCLPQCAEIARMHVNAANDALRLRLEVHAQQQVAIPLPAAARQWLPHTVLLDGKPTAGLLRDEQGALWARVPAGVHQLVLEGTLREHDSVQLALPLRPRRVEADVAGWTLEGVREHGAADTALQLTRRDRNGAGTLQGENLPPFVVVERTLELGLEWTVRTRVTRQTQANVPAVIEVPLLSGESITSAEPRVQNGKALVSMGPQSSAIEWESALAETPAITLTAANDARFVEVWRVNAGTHWRVAATGLAPVSHQDEGRWMPRWQPWPGESVALAISRPEGIDGQTITIDRSHLVLRPGIRATDAALSFTLRSSRGGQHTITLPAQATLQRIAINGQAQSIRLEERALRLPLTPGTSNVEVQWQEARGIGWRYVASEVDLGTPSVNARTQIVLPRDRWLLAVSGPTVGPAVLYWGVVIVIVLVALAMARAPGSPLPAWQWLLLGLGLSQESLLSAALIVGWFFAVALRERYADALTHTRWRFNLVQLALLAFTIVAAVALYFAVRHGLLGTPEMQVAGNGSNHYRLQWYQDRSSSVLPTPAAISASIFVYRALMLAWALWLAYALLKWSRWAWGAFSKGGVWRRIALVLPGRGRRDAGAPASTG